jgi:SAM-dependent methyltransferase
MSDDAAGFVGSIPQHYDQALGPIIFVDYAADIAQRVAAGNPARVLETAAGTGIVTRKLRDALPAGAHLTATDLNPPMLELARTKFRPGDISVAVARLEKEIPDAAIFARGLVYGNPLIDQVRARGGVEPELIVDALMQALRREFGADPGHMPLQAILYSATKRS